MIAKNVHIAFSSICFETWVLLHFEYTTAAFANYDELFSKKLKAHIKNYEKGIDGLYDLIKDKTDYAIGNSKKLNKYSQAANPLNTPVYQFNPYTNIPELFEALNSFLKEHNRQR